jgi:hypothetical protein
MRLDREGRYQESRARLRESQASLIRASYSAEAMDFIAEGDALLAAPAAAPYSESMRKQTLARSHEVARRRQGSPGGSKRQ